MPVEMTIACGEVKRLPTGRSYLLRIVQPWLEIELLDEAGKPVPDAAYEVTLADGSVRKGKLAEGKARLEKLPLGTCRVSFPDYDAASYERAPEKPAAAAPA